MEQSPPAEQPRMVLYEEPPESDPKRSPTTDWPAWSGPLALVLGLVVALVGAAVIDLPAAALGANLNGSHTPPGLVLADTVVQDLGFVLAAVFCARIGDRVARSWQFGLRPPGEGWLRAAGLTALLLVAFLVASGLWSLLTNPGKEKLLEQLGSNEGAGLLLLSAALTCVVAPVCEELLFRGYMFTALRNRLGTAVGALITGVIFGLVHAGSAPLLDLAPLALLGVGLCLLYRYTGSLYPSIAAHCINNCLAFTSLESWGWQVIPLLMGSLLAIVALARLATRVGLIARPSVAAI